MNVSKLMKFLSQSSFVLQQLYYQGTENFHARGYYKSNKRQVTHIPMLSERWKNWWKNGNISRKPVENFASLANIHITQYGSVTMKSKDKDIHTYEMEGSMHQYNERVSIEILVEELIEFLIIMVLEKKCPQPRKVLSREDWDILCRRCWRSSARYIMDIVGTGQSQKCTTRLNALSINLGRA
ncbi:990_t:CDS:2 [Funneliformis mosseae]|uniref:990_t:CDS:1 n=1 Tax=Funneliformis mosseae TaxID=27381 RepID=A0A9N9A0L5_FUNMO|nr:990_t:CDS:2 [Funneliformis mosseae]